MSTGTYKLEYPMYVISETDWKSLEAIPRSNEAQEKSLLVDVTSLSEKRKDCCIIFISHRWLRPNPKKETQQPHPDNRENEKFRLIRSALQVLRRQIGTAEVYLWCDFFGINQDDEVLKTKGIRSLPAYIERSDMLLTPIASNSNYTRNQVERIRARFAERGFKYVRKLGFSTSFAKDLDQFHHAEELFSRAWIRLEEFLGSNVPLDKEGTFNYFERINNHRTDRPHLFCTETMFGKEDSYYLISLPRLSKGVLQVLNPLDLDNSELTVESDREDIQAIMELAGYSEEEFSRPLKDVYEGEADEHGHRHGKGVLKYANGDEFHGEFEHNKRHGHGTYFYANGDKFEGTWVKNDRDENVPFVATLATGEVFDTKIKFIKKALRFGMFPRHKEDDSDVLYTKDLPK